MLGNQKDYDHRDGDTISFYDKMNHDVPANHKTHDKAVEESMHENSTRLSADDRTEIAQEIEGTSCMAVAETPEFLEFSLAKLMIELDSIPYKKKVGYHQSQKLPRTYINDKDFRLRFLRSQFFDEKEAAIRLVRYCDFALELFGSFALERPIQLSDFNKQEMKWFLKGYVQLMPFRDHSGRRVILQIMDSNIMHQQITRLKIYHYMAMIASEDIESQKRGVVLIVWPGGPGKDWKGLDKADRRSFHLLSQRHEVLPIRFAGYHYCMLDNPIFRLIRSFAVLYGHGGLGSGIKARMKFHIGVDTELRYKIQGYGIPVDYIPVTGTGNIKLNYLKQWISVRKIVEATQGRLAYGTIVECPGSNDVIFKPGKRLVFHPGNALFQELILSKQEEYTTTPAKRGLYRSLIHEIQMKRNGRFLRWHDDEYWTELKDHSQITIKISTSCKAVLNKSRKSGRANKNKTMIESSTSAFHNQIKRQRCDDVTNCMP